MWKTRLLIIFFALFVFGIFFYKALYFLDPDFGWHLKMGEIIISQKGVSQTDPFSYTMSNFRFIDHEWLTNVAIAFIYKHFGIGILSLIYLSIAFSALFISVTNPISRERTKGKINILKTIVPGILGVSLMLPFFGVRPQVESWLLLALFLRLFLNNNSWNKWRLLTPLFVAVWTNLHGSFPLPLFVMAIVLLGRSWRKRKVNKTDILIFVISVIATGVNPYGFRIWNEIWQQMSDGSLRWTIQEWRPAIFFTSFSFIAFLPLFTALIWRYRKNFLIEEKLLILFFLVQGLSSTRHLPLLLVVSLPWACKSIEYLYLEVVKLIKGGERFLMVGKVTLFLLLLILMNESVGSIALTKIFTETKYYPGSAINYLTTQSPAGNIFSEYAWGGYLIWKFPMKKVFIDGRMPSWKDKNGYKVMDDYVGILTGKTNYKPIFEKFEINKVLWPKDRNIMKKTGGVYLMVNAIAKRIGVNTNGFSFTQKLLEDGWKIIYEDETSEVYSRI